MEYCFQVEDVVKEQRGGTHTGLASRRLLMAPGRGMGQRGPMLRTERLDVTIQEYAPGGFTGDSAHADSEQVYMILEGRMRVVVEGREYLAEPGSVVTIPRNAHHENANVTEDGGVLKVLFINVVCT